MEAGPESTSTERLGLLVTPASLESSWILCLELWDSLKVFLFPNVAPLRHHSELTPGLWTPNMKAPGAGSGHACCTGLQSTLVWEGEVLCLSSVPKFKTVLKEEGKKVFS